MRHFLLATSLLLAPHIAMAGQCPAPPPVEPPSPTAVIVPEHNTQAQPRRLSAEDISRSPALQRISSNGAALWEIGDTMSNHGLRGIFAQKGQTFRTFYLTPDMQAEVGGVMWDASGHNITRDTVAMIQGVIPTINWQPGHTNTANPGVGQTEHQNAAHTDATNIVASASYGLYGHADAPRLYMVIDPLCPWSIRSIQSLQSYVESGQVQIAIVPISINDYENNHASTPAAQAMLSVGQKQMIDIWRQIIVQNHAPSDLSLTETSGAKLQLNLQKAHMIGLRGTPTIVWQDKQGASHVQSGLPDHLDQFIAGLKS